MKTSKRKKLEEEINLWENNLGFLAESKKANLLKDEFEKKIKAAKVEVEVLKEFPFGEGFDEGRAMLQIVHDVAPGADLAFHTGVVSPRDFELGIKALNKLTEGKVHLGLKSGYPVASAFADLPDVEYHYFTGPHPSGNVGIPSNISVCAPQSKGPYIIYECPVIQPISAVQKKISLSLY